MKDRTPFRDDDHTTVSDIETDSGRHSAPEPVVYMPVLVCIDGPQRGKRYPLRTASSIIGRGAKADINIDDDLASRSHARITYSNWEKSGEMPVCHIEDLESRNGTEVNGRTIKTATPLKERDRILVGSTILGFFLRDESEFQLEKSLYEMAAYDALTGLYNRHQFAIMMRHHYERARRYKRPLAMLLIDADNFKSVNDRLGHDAGDVALIHIARLIERNCRSSEIVARWGGEEFVVLLTESDERAIHAVAERIRAAVESTPIVVHADSVALSVSIGGAELRMEESAEEFFRRADQHLRRAKERGKNRVEFTAVDEA